METARVLALRGHKPTIYEKSDRLGGVFVAAAAPSFKEKDRELIAWYEKQMKDLGIEIKFNAEVSANNLPKADEVIVATGSKPRKLRLEGAEKAIEACEYLYGEKEVGDRVAIIGGGLTGCEIALDLILKGKTPIIVEAKNDIIAVKGVCLANSSYLRDFFEFKKVEIHLNSSLKKITDDGIIVGEADGKEISVKCDSVITSIGYNPAPLTENAKLVGDCLKVGNLRTVIWRAWDVAMKI